MKPKLDRTGLAGQIQQHRSSLLTDIVKGMAFEKETLSPLVRKQFKLHADRILGSLVRVLGEKEIDQTPFMQRHTLLDEARQEIHLTFKIEKLLIPAIKRLLAIAHDEWLGIRFMLNQGFHEILRTKVATGCANCRCAINEDLAKARTMELGLKKLIP